MKQKTFMGHPYDLINLFSIEIWERFSFYGMFAVLLIYMYFSPEQGGLGLPVIDAIGIIGAYNGGVYLASVLGGWIADRILGSEKTLFYSAIIIVIGHLIITIIKNFNGLCIGLPLIAIGAGGVKANASSMVGNLYTKNDYRRDSGFSLFYLGIYIGASIGPIVTGILQIKLGFHYSFGISAIGMTIGLFRYMIHRKSLSYKFKNPCNPLSSIEEKKFCKIGALLVITIFNLFYFGIFNKTNIDIVVIVFSIIFSLYLFYIMLKDTDVSNIEKNYVKAFIPLYITSAIFWMLYYQQATVLTIFADKQLDRNILGILEIPISWIQSINPIFVLLLSGMFSKIWNKLGEKQPGTLAKFIIAMILASISCFVMTYIANMKNNSAPLLYMIFALLILSIAELFLSPIGLSVSTKLAPDKYRTQMVSLFFLSMSLGATLSGYIASYYKEDNGFIFFITLGVISIVFSCILFAFYKPTQKLMGSIR